MINESGDDMEDEHDKQETEDQYIIDKDLHEEFTDEELQEVMEEAREEYRRKAIEREKKKKKRSRFTKFTIWIISLAMVFNIIALLPETFSIPAIQFLKTSASLSTQSDIKQYKKAVVLIETAEGKGTGFSFTADGEILTNYHVIEGYDNVTVGFPEEGLFEGKVTETYPGIDLAVVEIQSDEDVRVPALELADTFQLQAKEDVYFIGNPLRFTGIANKGEILDYVNVKSKNKPVVMMHAPVYRGNSGSPVINKEGKVIGVVFATMFHDEAGRVGLFIPIDYYYDAK